MVFGVVFPYRMRIQNIRLKMPQVNDSFKIWVWFFSPPWLQIASILWPASSLVMASFRRWSSVCAIGVSPAKAGADFGVQNRLFVLYVLAQPRHSDFFGVLVVPFPPPAEAGASRQPSVCSLFVVLGGLIQTARGSSGRSGGPFTKRSACAL